jgi:putative ABC transport system substrate-binding protein
MKRREFITLLGAAVVWPLAARAQQPAKVPRVGILSPAASETAATLTAFREGIRDLGYIEEQTIALDFRLSNGIMDALPALAAELVRIPVNVIVTDSTSATLAAFDATRTIPIVMGATGGDPVALGLAKSFSRPGGNVTGTQFLTGLSDKRLQLLKQAFPGAQRVAVLADPTNAISVSEMPKAEMAASRIGLRLVSLAASTPAELRALAPAALSGSDGLLVMPDAMFWNNRATILDIASMARMPAIIRSGNTPMMEGSSPTGPMCLRISVKLLATSIVSFTELTLAIFPSTLLRNSISSSISVLPTLLGLRFHPILSLPPTR